MTSKAESLLVALDESAYARNGSGEHSKAYFALASYIEELERKAQAYDNLDATAESIRCLSIDQLRSKLAELQRASGIPASERETERGE